MRAFVTKFYRDGPDAGKPAQITVKASRKDLRQVKTWTPEQKAAARKFITDAQAKSKLFYAALLKHL